MRFLSDSRLRAAAVAAAASRFAAAAAVFAAAAALVASSASRASASARAGMASIASCLGTNNDGSENATGSASLGEMITRIPIGALSNTLLSEIERHAHAAMRGRVARQGAAMQRDAVPGDAQHVRHPGIVIKARMVILVLLHDGKDPRWRLASGRAGRYRRAQDPAVGVVEGHLLALDRHDGHDRFRCRALSLRFHGLRVPRLPGSSVGRRRGNHAASARPRASQWWRAPGLIDFSSIPRWKIRLGGSEIRRDEAQRSTAKP